MALACADFYDAELRHHNAHLRIAARPDASDRVLDIGCGAGQTTRDAARIAVEGEAIGIDISAPMLEVARRRTAKEGLPNAMFERGDAQTHAFLPASFDLCLSRFGVMFFGDPAVAFANIAKTMRPGARLVWLVWQSQDRNPWSSAIRQVLMPGSATPARTMSAFSLGDPIATRDLLHGAGFSAVDFADLQEPVFYGATVDAAYDALTGLQFFEAQTVTDETQWRLREMLRAHLIPDGVHFDSRAWIITARRLPS